MDRYALNENKIEFKDCAHPARLPQKLALARASVASRAICGFLYSDGICGKPACRCTGRLLGFRLCPSFALAGPLTTGLRK